MSETCACGTEAIQRVRYVKAYQAGNKKIFVATGVPLCAACTIPEDAEIVDD